MDIAKESADIILLEKDLTVLEQGVIQGRTTFGNTIKYIKMTASSNFGNVFSVLVASAFIPFQPMLAIMLLVQNLVYDISQLATPWDRMDEEYLRKPRNWDAKGIFRFMVTIGPVSSVFDISMFLIMWNVFAADSEASQSLFQSGWFIEGLLSQTLIVHVIRTRKIPFIQSRASWPVMVMTVLAVLTGLYLPFSPLAASLGFVALPHELLPVADRRAPRVLHAHAGREDLVHPQVQHLALTRFPAARPGIPATADWPSGWLPASPRCAWVFPSAPSGSPPACCPRTNRRMVGPATLPGGRADRRAGHRPSPVTAGARPWTSARTRPDDHPSGPSRQCTGSGTWS